LSWLDQKKEVKGRGEIGNVREEKDLKDRVFGGLVRKRGKKKKKSKEE